MRTATIIFELLLMALLGYVLYCSISYKGIARLVPLVIGIPAAGLLAFTLIGERFPGLLRAFNTSILDLVPPKVGETGQADNGGSQAPVGKEVWQVFRAFLWMSAFFAGIFFVGYLLSIPLFVFAYLLFSARLVWWRSALFAAGISVVVWGVFTKGMALRLFEGRLFDAFVPPI